MKIKTKQFVARVIEDGRITIPKDVRQSLKIKEGNYVVIHLSKLDLFRASMHVLFAPGRLESIAKKQVSTVKFE